jgi:hypothetical protein
MTVQAVLRYTVLRRSRGTWLTLGLVAVLTAAAGAFVSYVLWPTWPRSNVPLDAPAIPVTIAGVLFNVPPAAIRAPVQRHPGAHERIDLAFLWPSLEPPAADGSVSKAPAVDENGAATAPRADERLFVSVAGLGAVLPPLTRLRTVYPRYIEATATAGPDGLAIVAFRAGTPYEGEDLVYVAEKPEQFFALCSRPNRSLPGTCTQERSLDAAEITLRFSRGWLEDWRGAAARFDRLVAQLHAGGN